MAQWTKDEVQELLEAKMRSRIAAIKRVGHKPDALDLASDLAPYVIALMCDARRRELLRVINEEDAPHPTLAVKLKVRYRALKKMAEVLWNFAEKHR